MFDELHISQDWDKFDNYCQNQSQGLKTGFKQIDSKIIGLPGFVTVQGEPKCCKSTFVMNIAMYNAMQGIPVILLDKENGINRTRLRMLCYLAGITSGAIKSGNFINNEKKDYSRAVKYLLDLPIYYVNNTDQEHIELMIQAIGEKHNSPVILIADSLQSLVQDFKDRRASVDHWIFMFNELKIKYENQLTIMVVSEKKRDSYGMSSKSGGKESGGIEYKSEMVLDMYIMKDSPAITVECTYNRDGDTGIVSNLFKTDPYTFKLEDSEYIPEEF